jgi:hypothetical protein
MNAPDRKQGHDGERMLVALVDLARHAYTDDLSAAENLGQVRLEETWQRTRSSRRRWFSPSGPVLAAALAVALVLPGAYLMYGRHPRLTYQVANGTVEADGRIHQTRPGTVVVFSEGSQIDVEAGTRARVVSTTSEGGRVLLEDGDLRADIVHRPRTHWSVEAGPYTIRVTGTAFDVRWSVADDRLECRMKHGSVVITGPLVPTGVTLTAGMRLTVSPRSHQLALDDASSGLAAAPLAARALAAAPGTEPASSPVNDDRGLSNEATSRHRTVALVSPRRREPTRRSEAQADESGPSWSRRLALGEFQSVLTDAERQGLDRVIERAPATDLSALADAARYTHHVATSRRALLALRARFPETIESRDTAFFLGGLAEDETGANATATSIGWYEQYLRECPNGRFVNEAMGRNMVLAHKLRGAAAARPTADEYLRRFPRGPYAAAARKLLRNP